jgi:hypothetical protein
VSTADEILYAPIEPSWQTLAQTIDDYIRTVGAKIKPMKQLFDMDRPRPEGSLTLLELMRQYHEENKKQFYVVSWGRSRMLESLPFNGNVLFLKYENGSPPMLATYSRHSIRDLNLVPNTYSLHYVFLTEDHARAYYQSL